MRNGMRANIRTGSVNLCTIHWRVWDTSGCSHSGVTSLSIGSAGRGGCPREVHAACGRCSGGPIQQLRSPNELCRLRRFLWDQAVLAHHHSAPIGAPPPHG